MSEVKKPKRRKGNALDSMIKFMDAANKGLLIQPQKPKPVELKAVLKPHQFSQLANELRDIAVEYKNTQQLRSQIVNVLEKYIDLI